MSKKKLVIMSAYRRSAHTVPRECELFFVESKLLHCCCHLLIWSTSVADRQRGGSLLCGLPCLLLRGSSTTSSSNTGSGRRGQSHDRLKLLLQAAGGAVTDSPQTLVAAAAAAGGVTRHVQTSDYQQQQQQQQEMMPSAQNARGGVLSPGFGPDGKPYGLIFLVPPDEPTVGSSSKAGGGGGGGGGSGSGGSSRRHQSSGRDVWVAGKAWAQQQGLGGWPLYNKEWLIRAVLSYAPDWAAHCGVVPQE